ncbi:MAG: tetraacyldisaccharide 4'-kinase [Armatimonadetes bacterium]|nr:tetraacyldisaccharide 4'-kinase [Armatimonadota bacterium]
MASGLTDYWQRAVMAGDARGMTPAALRALAASCARLYEAGLEAYLGLERVGLRRRERLPVPVVSVGNLTVGGTGKTPMTRLLCRRLTDGGRRVAVLSRGHGGRGRGVRLVSDAHGNIARSAADAGDEPLLLAQTLPGVPVLVGKDRRQAGREALRRFALDALVLDDGFQFWQLARDLDIVLLDARRPFDNGHALPRGLLREPARHLSRAGVAVVTRADALDDTGREALRARVAALAPVADLYWARHAATGLVPVGEFNAPTLPLDALRGRRVLAWSAIARPDSFAGTLAATGAEIVAHIAQPDHYAPAVPDVERVRRRMQEEHADALVMTEKDAVKWPDVPGVPVYALRVEMQVEDEVRFLAVVLRRLFGG